MIREALVSDFSVLKDFYQSFSNQNLDLENKDPFSKIFVYEMEENIIGFIHYSIIYDRAEINYVYVMNQYRRKHIASSLMEHCIKECIQNKCLNITLEVNEKNIGGIGLYTNFGFKEAAKRKNYYHGEDAILMIRELK